MSRSVRRLLKILGGALLVLVVMFAGLIVLTQGSALQIDDRLWWPDLEQVRGWTSPGDKPA